MQNDDRDRFQRPSPEAQAVRDKVTAVKQRNRLLANELTWFVNNLPKYPLKTRAAVQLDYVAKVIVDETRSDHYPPNVENIPYPHRPEHIQVLIDSEMLHTLAYLADLESEKASLATAKRRRLVLEAELTWFVTDLKEFYTSLRIDQELDIARAILKGEDPPARPGGESSAADQSLRPHWLLEHLLRQAEAADDHDPIGAAAIAAAKQALDGDTQ